MIDTDTYVDDLGINYEQDEHGINHAHHTRETSERLQEIIDAVDRLQVRLGAADKQELLDYFDGNREAMIEAALRL